MDFCSAYFLLSGWWKLTRWQLSINAVWRRWDQERQQHKGVFSDWIRKWCVCRSRRYVLNYYCFTKSYLIWFFIQPDVSYIGDTVHQDHRFTAAGFHLAAVAVSSSEPVELSITVSSRLSARHRRQPKAIKAHSTWVVVWYMTTGSERFVISLRQQVAQSSKLSQPW